MSRPRVRAAGGAVWRQHDPGGGVEVVIVHRPRYDDWSLPKGKLHRGESHRDAALREVLEETGLRCTAGEELVSVRYETPRGEDKSVRWWAMTVDVDEGFVPNDEVDELCWWPIDEVADRCTPSSDRDVVHSLATLLGCAKPT